MSPSTSPIVHVVQGQQYAAGVGAVDFISDPAFDGSVTVTHDPDPEVFAERCVEAGRHYEREAIMLMHNASPIPWMPVPPVPFHPTVPVKGLASSHPSPSVHPSSE
jgi:hypothetical protein